MGYLKPKILHQMTLPHPRFQLDCLTVNHKGATAAVVDGLRIPLRRIDPGFEHFKNEKIIFVDKAPVGHLTFEIGKAFGDERRLYVHGAELGGLNVANLSRSRPDELPIATTFVANLRAGIAITHSPVMRSAAKL